MEWKLFADLADTVGSRRVTVDVATPATVHDAIEALVRDHPALRDRVFDEAGGLQPHVNVVLNGRDVTNDQGLATPVEETDELGLFPPVSGG